MRIEQLACAIEAHLIVSNGRQDSEITRVYGGVTMSDLIANAGPGTLLVTSLANSQLMRVAELMDVPGICLVEGSLPGAALIAQARAAGTALCVSHESLHCALERATRCFASVQEPQR